VKATLAAVISVTTRKLFCDGTKEMKSFMAQFTGHAVWNHDLGRIADSMEPWLFAQHPFLKDLDVSRVSRENVWDELAKLEAQYGKELELEPMPSSAIADLSPQESLGFAGYEGKVIEI
jgi:hypothetical protein